MKANILPGMSFHLVQFHDFPSPPVLLLQHRIISSLFQHVLFQFQLPRIEINSFSYYHSDFVCNIDGQLSYARDSKITSRTAFTSGSNFSLKLRVHAQSIMRPLI